MPVCCTPLVLKCAAPVAIHRVTVGSKPPLTINSVGVLTAFCTVTLTTVDVADAPSASVTRLVNACAPLTTRAVSHAIEYGEVVSVAMSVAPSKNSTRVTPADAVALAAIVTLPLTVAPLAGAVIAVDGGRLLTVNWTAVEAV